MDPSHEPSNEIDKTQEPVTSGLPKNSVSEQAIRFAGSTLGAYRHICGFFHNPDEEYRVLLPFIQEGFERGEKGFHIVDPQLRDEHIARLRAIGIDLEAAAQRGQFELRN